MVLVVVAVVIEVVVVVAAVVIKVVSYLREVATQDAMDFFFIIS